MTTYPLCVAWNVAIDADFIAIMRQLCAAHGLPLLLITPDNLPQILRAILRQEIAFEVFLDRASDTDIRFVPLVYWTRDRTRYRINPYEIAIAACDKAAMHYRLVSQGIPIPATLVFPPWNATADVPCGDVSVLGVPFVMKPAHGRGGEGVRPGLRSKEHVQIVRKAAPGEAFLAQRFVTPIRLDGLPAWFRVIYCLGKSYVCWWNPDTHRYAEVSPDECRRHALHPLEPLTRRIAAICELDLFSSEIALSEHREFFVIDYVNDQIDLRLQSKFYDGLPDALVHEIVCRIIRFAKEQSVASHTAVA